MAKNTPPDERVTVGKAAELLDVDESHVRRLCRAGLLRGEKWGRDWQVFASSVAEYKKTDHPRGRKPGKRNGSGQSVRP
jgi:excisionase family DNA binding protein